jgi:long-chain acyl-CoA synthetase
MKLRDSKIMIIDRKKSIFKLARGEFVAYVVIIVFLVTLPSPEMLENSYLLCRYISQIFLHGEVGRSFLVAIIVPNFGVLRDWMKEQNMVNTFL